MPGLILAEAVDIDATLAAFAEGDMPVDFAGVDLAGSVMSKQATDSELRVSVDLTGVGPQRSGERGGHRSNLAEHAAQIGETTGPANDDVGALE